MTSLFIDSATRVDGDFYRIPTKIEFNGVKLRSAMILNNTYNVLGFGVTLTIPSRSFAQTFTISDGMYDGPELAAELQNLMNAEFVDDDWKIIFSNATRKFTFTYKYSSTSSAFLTFNTASQAFFGASAMTFVTDSFIHEDSVQSNQSVSVQGFYRIECPSLSAFGFMEHDTPHSGLLAVVPISTGFGRYTIYENSDSFLMTSSGLNDVYNFIQVKIYIGDSQVPIPNPIFGLTLQFM